jgi:hypothetical protein
MYGPETYHSRNFNTIWTNSGHVARKDNASSWGYFPLFDNTEANYLTKDHYYLSNTNDLDGLTTCFFSLYDKTFSETNVKYSGDHYITGLFRPNPFTPYNNNRIGYDTSGDGNFVALNEENDSLFTYEYAPIKKKGQWGDFGVDKEQIHGLSIVSLRENTKEMFEWLFDIGAIPGKDSKSKDKTETTSKRKRPRKRNKSKSKSVLKD